MFVYALVDPILSSSTCLRVKETLGWFRTFNEKREKKIWRDEDYRWIITCLLFLRYVQCIIKCDRHMEYILTGEVQVTFRLVSFCLGTPSNDVTCQKNRPTGWNLTGTMKLFSKNWIIKFHEIISDAVFVKKIIILIFSLCLFIFILDPVISWFSAFSAVNSLVVPQGQRCRCFRLEPW